MLLILHRVPALIAENWMQSMQFAALTTPYPAAVAPDAEPRVLRLRDIEAQTVAALLSRFGLKLKILADGAEIPGSYWGECEAGLIGDSLYARPDTPLHSILHEACHWITCTPERRAQVHTDAADTEEEEGATCWLQIVLADDVPGFGRERALVDMDAWGYSFRLGSAKAWFEHDAEDAQAWLRVRALIDDSGACTWRVRDTPD